MTATYDVWADPELTELVQTDPMLIAIADALTEAAPAAAMLRKRVTRRKMTYLAVAAAIVVAAAIPAVALATASRASSG